MKLYERDYLILTDEEEALRLACAERCKGIHKTSDYFNVPKAVTHYRTLFPNNYLDPNELEKHYVETAVGEFSELLDDPITCERDVLSFVRKRRYYFLIGSLLRNQLYGFGHHAAYLFPEFRLGNNYTADYLIVGKGSNGHEFIFVEMESPGRSTIGAGTFGEVFRKGIHQTDLWKIWLEENFTTLRPTFEKYQNPQDVLPREFGVQDSTRLHFVVVGGRRKDFSDLTYRLAREERGKGTRRLLHYDHLIDLGQGMASVATY